MLLDYLLAFTVLGLADLFSKPFKSRAAASASAPRWSACCALCAAFVGYIVWKDYDYAVEWLTNFEWGANFINSMGQDALCWFYSFVYNLSYMLPETILTVIGALILYKACPSCSPGRRKQVSAKTSHGGAGVWRACAAVSACAAGASMVQ